MVEKRAAGIVFLLVLACGPAGLFGCTSDPRYKEGLGWVQWNEAER